MSNSNREHRCAAVQEMRVVRADDAPPVIEGHAAVFDIEADFRWFVEVIRPGAFANSLKNGDDVRALFNHDPNLILGRNAADTLTLAEDGKGLKYRIVPPDTQAARDLLASIERGDISQSSFGFEVISEAWTQRKDEPELREILEVKLYDVSPVTFPAYAETDVGVAKRHRDEACKGRAARSVRVQEAQTLMDDL